MLNIGVNGMECVSIETGIRLMRERILDTQSHSYDHLKQSYCTDC